jgi:hypothetical protein
VAVFAMLQLPGLLDDAVFWLRPRFTREWAWPLTLVYLYAKSAAVILAGTFILHLMLRARWIALVGLLSVHPGGIAWGRMRLGPIAESVERERAGSPADILERADNLASVVFAAGVTVAVLLLVVAVVAVGGLAVAALFGARPDSNAFLVVLLLVMGPYFVAQALDRKAPGFVARHPALARGLDRLFRGYSRLGIGTARSPAMAILASNAGRTRAMLMVTGLMFLAIGGVTWSYVLMRDPGNALGNYALFPEAGVGSRGALAASHYDDQRDPSRDAPDPYVPSAVAWQPWLRLVVPYVPVRDEPALRERCPAAREPAGEADDAGADARTPALLACLGALYPVALDGKRLDVRYEAGSDPRTERPAAVAMIDLRGLPRGRHELLVGVPPKLDRDGNADAAAAQHRIPFWR